MPKPRFLKYVVSLIFDFNFVIDLVWITMNHSPMKKTNPCYLREFARTEIR
jgi:hypothetical protein